MAGSSCYQVHRYITYFECVAYFVHGRTHENSLLDSVGWQKKSRKSHSNSMIPPKKSWILSDSAVWSHPHQAPFLLTAFDAASCWGRCPSPVCATTDPTDGPPAFCALAMKFTNWWDENWVFLYDWLVGGDWNHGMDYDFPIILGRIIPTDELICFRGVGIPPTSWICWSLVFLCSGNPLLGRYREDLLLFGRS